MHVKGHRKKSDAGVNPIIQMHLAPDPSAERSGAKWARHRPWGLNGFPFPPWNPSKQAKRLMAATSQYMTFRRKTTSKPSEENACSGRRICSSGRTFPNPGKKNSKKCQPNPRRRKAFAGPGKSPGRKGTRNQSKLPCRSGKRMRVLWGKLAGPGGLARRWPAGTVRYVTPLSLASTLSE